MSVLVVEYDAEGKITDWEYEADHDYSPDEDEIIAPEPVDHRDIDRMEVDVTADPPSLVEVPPEVFGRPSVVDNETRELIGEKFRVRGADALGELDAIEGNTNIPPEVTAYLQDVFAMQYLTYVSLTGDRVKSVEDRFFG